MAKILKLNHRISTLCFGDLEDLEIGDKIEIRGINKDLLEDEYNSCSSNFDFIRRYESETHSKFRITIPIDKHGRYVIIEKLEGLFK
tara:strand:+ start:4137 stop:4397 length:261 start_codon:yes stop_codon:yes gene_type:complete